VLAFELDERSIADALLPPAWLMQGIGSERVREPRRYQHEQATDLFQWSPKIRALSTRATSQSRRHGGRPLGGPGPGCKAESAPCLLFAFDVLCVYPIMLLVAGCWLEDCSPTIQVLLLIPPHMCYRSVVDMGVTVMASWSHCRSAWLRSRHF
jgi:hypothetical protein